MTVQFGNVKDGFAGNCPPPFALPFAAGSGGLELDSGAQLEAEYILELLNVA